MNFSRYLKVAVPSPLRKPLDYLAPDSINESQLQPGQRVRVPFRNKETIGIIISINSDSDFPDNKLKTVLSVLDDEPTLSPHLLKLYSWASEYYHYPIGLALQTSLPAAIRAGKPLALNEAPHWKISDKGQLISIEELKRAPRQQQIISLLSNVTSLPAEEITKQIGNSCHAPLKALAEKGLIEKGLAEKTLPGNSHKENMDQREVSQALALNQAQQKAFNGMSNSLGSYHCHLLEGVTGSGKTEIYLQLIEKVLQQGQQVLVLVPEIGLTPQTLSRFQKRFTQTVSLIHSNLNDTQRMHAWLTARNDKTGIVIGTRSAVFTPLGKPGLIIVDEEHDSSFKQQDGFRYSARDVAIYRARQLDIPIVLGTATPSLESLQNAVSGRYQHHLIDVRAGAAKLPSFRFIDLCGEKMIEGFAPVLFDQIQHHLSQGQQVLIFINRRGFSPLLQCHHCGWVADCQRCEMSYTLHQSPPLLRCHHCESQSPVPKQCQQCSSAELIPLGHGTERSENILKERFPTVPVLRVDRDSTRTKGSLNQILETVNQEQPCILIGTQMLAKGHHFPKVTLVAILDADSGLFSANFRGEEFLGQLITQVAGRAGRGHSEGEVLIQTHHSSHPTLQQLVTEGYSPLARQLLNQREHSALPPFTFQALIKAEASERSLPMSLLSQIEQFCRQQPNNALDTLGPLPAPLEKKAGKFRFQLILQATQRSILHANMANIIAFIEANPLSRKARWSVDIDPQDFS